MSLENTEVIDALGVASSNGRIVLTIIDSWNWENERAHLIALQSKINAYLAYVESNQIADIEPAWREKGARLEVIFRHSPSQDAVALLKTAEFVAQALDLIVSYRVHQS